MKSKILLPGLVLLFTIHAFGANQAHRRNLLDQSLNRVESNIKMQFG